MDPDIQDELQAMAGASNVPAFGANRITNRGDLRTAINSRPLFSGENHGASSINSTNATQQSGRAFSPPPPVVLSTTDRATKMELEAILRKPAHTPEEKFLALDARDKLIRLTTVKNVDISKATSTKGVCPDMCPEKERMSRESKHRVANFELEEGSKSVMNHIIAVKEYSRSSADQESPLPHELRPEPVLKLTMTYLLQNIMDLCDDPETSLCDWYHFLWDRTRSIRKDITQQELCSTETVLLVEQCARFHIHSAARLIAEEPSVFDQRINTENLTKCLQSLKYIYHDLDLKRIRCPNEAEFRAYVVLLNLHDSNFLWEVKQLREEIQHSPEIQFAIKVYLAIESDNYVKFFSLVRSTTYMNACILLRYFTQVRIKALHIMFKAYAPRNNSVYMPLSNLTYLLAFEDAEQCAQFLEYHGLTVERDYDRVILSLKSFVPPELPYIMDRAINVVEHKRHSSVGEAVHGAPLDSKNVLDKYEPHDSFDENGILLPRAWSADDQNYYKPEARIEARMNKSAPTPAKEDESVFKMPLAPPKSSPKSRLSPKPAVSAENAFTNLSNTSSTSLFGSNKFNAPSTQSGSDGLFKIQSNQMQTSTNNLFGGFAQSSHANLFGKPASNSAESKTVDTHDGGSFRFTSNAAFSKPIDKSVPNNSIFSSADNIKAEFGSGLFSQIKPSANQTPNLFGNAANSGQSSIFGSFANQNKENDGFTGQTSFKSVGHQISGTSLFGGFKEPSTSISGIMPLQDADNEVAIKLAKEKEAARLKEEERKRKEAEENERRKRAELEEQERQRKKAEEELKKQREREKKRQEIEKLSAKYVDEIVDEYVSNNLLELTNNEIKRYRALEESINKIYTDIANEVVSMELERIAFDVKTAWDKNILEKYFACWRNLTRKKIEQREKIANTPVWLSTKSMKELIPELHHPLQSKTLSLMKRYRSGLPSKLIAPPIREDSIDLWNVITPELVKLMAQIKSKQPLNIYWKCIISLPDTDEDASCKSISQWLDNVFYRQLSKYPRQNDIFFVEQHEINNQRINACMRKLIGKKLINESKTAYTSNDIDGTNAILFFMTTKNLHETQARFKAVMKAIELNSAAGIIIYNLDINDLHEVRNALNLYDFMDDEKIDECIFANDPQNRSMNNLYHLTKHALKYTAANSFYDDQLEMQQIVSFLRICLADELWQRIYHSVNRNPTLLEASTQINFLMDYHNEAIDRLVSMCTLSCIDSPMLFSFELRKFVPKHQIDIPLALEYFPENWHQTAEKNIEQIVGFLKSLKVQKSMNINDITDIAALETAILKFVRVHISSKSAVDRTAYKMIQHILAYMGSKQLNALEFKEKLTKYSWLDAFPIFATDFLSYQYQCYVNEKRLPDYVIYDKYEYQDYIRTAWWLQTNENMLKNLTTNVLRNMDAAVYEYEQNRKRQKLEETIIATEEKKNLDDILAKGFATLANADNTLNRMKEIQATCKDISKDLDYNLYKQEKNMRDLRYTWKNSNE